jgi:hypothetical protein
MWAVAVVPYPVGLQPVHLQLVPLVVVDPHLLASLGDAGEIWLALVHLLVGCGVPNRSHQ